MWSATIVIVFVLNLVYVILVGFGVSVDVQAVVLQIAQ